MVKFLYIASALIVTAIVVNALFFTPVRSPETLPGLVPQSGPSERTNTVTDVLNFYRDTYKVVPNMSLGQCLLNNYPNKPRSQVTLAEEQACNDHISEANAQFTLLTFMGEEKANRFSAWLQKEGKNSSREEQVKESIRLMQELPSPVRTDSPGLDLLRNAVVQSNAIKSGKIQLVNGKAEVDVDEVHLVVELVGPVTFGDLNGDGLNDAVTVLSTMTGGTGVFIDLALFINEKGKLVHVSSADLGDRIKVESVTITSARQVQVRMVTHGPNDGLCCPTMRVTKTYGLQDSRLVEQVSEPKKQEQRQQGREDQDRRFQEELLRLQRDHDERQRVQQERNNLERYRIQDSHNSDPPPSRPPLRDHSSTQFQH
jgi:hypothetical protein